MAVVYRAINTRVRAVHGDEVDVVFTYCPLSGEVSGEPGDIITGSAYIKGRGRCELWSVLYLDDSGKIQMRGCGPPYKKKVPAAVLEQIQNRKKEGPT
jgi:hypothetical protein